MNARNSAISFASLGLSDQLLLALQGEGYVRPYPVQAQAIPPALQGRDLLAAAQTGTGKTASFALPILQRLASSESVVDGVRALILTPTRELAAQVEESVATYGKNTLLRTAVVYGGVPIEPQITQLKQGVDVLVATPGRLLDLLGQGALTLRAVEFLVLDEADRMLDLGFIDAIRQILKKLPKQRQNLLFSATFSEEILQLAGGILRDPVRIEISPRNSAAQTVKQSVYAVDWEDKPDTVRYLVEGGSWEKVLVFIRTKKSADQLAQQLVADGIPAAAIHSNKSQILRTRTLAAFKRGEVRVLVATDIAARGLDIEQLPLVINYDLPRVAEDYVHRIGRSGRAGAEGRAITLLGPTERKWLAGIEQLLKRQLPTEPIPFFENGVEQPVEMYAEPSPAAKKNARNKGQRKAKSGANPNPNRKAKTDSGAKRSHAGGREGRNGAGKNGRTDERRNERINERQNPPKNGRNGDGQSQRSRDPQHPPKGAPKKGPEPRVGNPGDSAKRRSDSGRQKTAVKRGSRPSLFG